MKQELKVSCKRKRKELISKLRRYLARVKRLRRMMPVADALRLAFPKAKPREVEVYLSSVKRTITLRRGTSDIRCMEKVFLHEEYQTPLRVDPQIIVDAGANIGLATVFFSHKYPQAKIVAVEPEPSNFAILRKNCTGLPNTILINAALWPTDEALVIENSTVEKWAFRVTERKEGTNSESVKAVTIPGLLRRLRVEHIDILKLDIEGGERELFSLGAESWLGSVRQIIIELHDRFVSGCAFAFYTKITQYQFIQEIRGENIFVTFGNSCADAK
jgi:FkbM family methyltransferase